MSKNKSTETITLKSLSLDNRYKLTDKQREEILYKRNINHSTVKSLCEEYNVSRSTIDKIINPKYLEASRKASRERNRKVYHNTEITPEIREQRTSHVRKQRAKRRQVEALMDIM